MSDTPLFVGVGSPHRQDDGLGPWLAERLRQTGLRTVSLSGDGTHLLDLFRDNARLVILDATQSGCEPGTHHRLDAIAGPVPASLFRYSTHRFAVAEAIETARALEDLPESLILHGIEGETFGYGQGLSQKVSQTAYWLLARLQQGEV